MIKFICSNRANTSGYTLIELLLYISIIGALLTSVTMFLGATVDSRVKNQSISEVEQQGMLAMELITQTIRNADSITTPATGASGSTLTLVVPTGALSPTTFNLSSNTLQITEGVAAALPITNSKVQVTSLTFRNLSRASTPGVVQVAMTMSRVNTLNRNEYDYQKTFTTSAALRWP